MISEVFEEIKVHTALLLRSSMLAGTRVSAAMAQRIHGSLSRYRGGSVGFVRLIDATVYPKCRKY